VAESHFTVVIPAYNCERWVEKNLKSAVNQEYKNCHITYIDDASTDNTLSLAQNILSKSNKSFNIVKNKNNQKALRNLYEAVYAARKDTIIVALDGDDWLINKSVLKRLDAIYKEENPWVTSGAYIDNVEARIHKPKISESFWNGNIREKEWSLSHLRTFRRDLFLQIRKSDFMDLDGDFFKFTWDRAIMYPMAEMAGPSKLYPVSTPLYVYNRINPISVDRIHRGEQLRIETLLRRKSPYGRLSVL